MNPRKDPANDDTLHLLLTHAGDSAGACLSHLREGDSMVLLNTAVLHLLDRDWLKSLPANIRLYAVTADLEAHGLGEISTGSGIARVDDEGWARLVMSHAHCLSWK